MYRLLNDVRTRVLSAAGLTTVASLLCLVVFPGTVQSDPCNWEEDTNVGAECSGMESLCTDVGCSMSSSNNTHCDGFSELDYGSMTDPTYLYQQAAGGSGTGTVNLSSDPPTPTTCYIDYDCRQGYVTLTPCENPVCNVNKSGTVDGNCFSCSKGDELSRLTYNLYDTEECEME